MLVFTLLADEPIALFLKIVSRAIIITGYSLPPPFSY
jgi:hypothetical protein